MRYRDKLLYGMKQLAALPPLAQIVLCVSDERSLPSTIRSRSATFLSSFSRFANNNPDITVLGIAAGIGFTVALFFTYDIVKLDLYCEQYPHERGRARPPKAVTVVTPKAPPARAGEPAHAG